MKHLYRISILLLITSLFFSGCTLHFKATDLEMDSEVTKNNPDATENTNRTFELISIDFAKN